MTNTAIAADFSQALDVHRQIAAQIAFDVVVASDNFAQLGLILIAEVLDADVRVDTGLLQDLSGAGAADTEDLSERDLDALVLRKINSCNTSHILLAPPFP